MKNIVSVFALLLVITSSTSFANKTNALQKLASATGTFKVDLAPQNDDASAGRIIINKIYSGDLVGSGIGQMISKRTAGSSAYYAIEEFEGSLNGRKGSFTLTHSGFMSKETQSLEVMILEGSGDGELKDISGSMSIIQKDGNHSYVLEYKL